VREENTRERIIVTFLALLELCRLKLVHIFQGTGNGPIWFVPAVAVDLSRIELS
jgi:segregation and condensation protein A